jgi:DNA polymerase/3'-5' exonuclease PolX
MNPCEIIDRALVLMDKLRTDPRVLQVDIVGSVRRGLADVGDLDLLITTHDPWSFDRGHLPPGAFRRAEWPSPSLRPADLFFCTPETYGAALACATGPLALNFRLRELASKRGLWLDFRSSGKGGLPVIMPKYSPFVGLCGPDGRVIATPTEEIFFNVIEAPYVPPAYRSWLAKRLSN